MVYGETNTYVSDQGLSKRNVSAIGADLEVGAHDELLKPQSIACDSCGRNPCTYGCARLRIDFISPFPCEITWRPCALWVEFLCCILLGFFLGMSGLLPGSTQVSSALVHGAILTGAIASATVMSGAHFSGFLSLAIALNGKLSWWAVPFYWLAQFLGFLVGTALLLIFFDTSTLLNIPIPQAPFSALQAFAMEIIGTFAITLFVFFAQRHKVNVAIVLGLAFIGIVIVGLPISGACFNFWRYLTPAIFVGQWGVIWVYLVGDFLGVILAWIAFRICCWLERYNDQPISFC